ncbi:MAG: DUF2358 domain-containing protein [Halothece sp.]
MNILEILKQDYQRFPDNQTYDIYSENVYFKDPVNEFRGVKRYQKMIHFLGNFFNNVQMDVHDIRREGNTIYTDWTLHLTPPLPWKPRLSIPGRSELKLNENDQITAHIDYWHISRWDVLKQNFSSSPH